MSDAETADAVVAGLSARGVRLWYEGYRLRFQAPKGALDAPQRALLASQRAEVIARLRESEAARADELPVSHPQFMMWFQNQLAPTSTVCTIGWAWHVRGPVELGALRHAVQALVDRHAILRTTYHLLEQSVVQRIAGAAPAALDILPLPQAVAVDGEVAWSEHLAAQIARPYDLETGPVMRVVLFTDAALEHMLLATFHHIAVDARSMDLLRHELLTLYQEFADQQPPRLARPAATYADFVGWQAREIAGASGERQSAWWRRMLAAPRQQSAFPPRLATPGASRFSGASLRFDLDGTLTTAVRGLAARVRTTPFVVLLGAFQLLVARLCAIRDVVTGTPALGRPTSEYESVVGNFINVLPVRSRLEAGEAVTVFLERLHGTVVGALEQQHYPLSRIVQEQQTSREASGQTLFNTSFTMLKSEAPARPAVPGAPVPATSFSWHPLVFQAGLLDLSLDVFANDSDMQCFLKHSLAVLSIDAAKNLSNEYARLVGAMTAAPGEALGALLDEPGGDLPDNARAAHLQGGPAMGAAGILASLRSMGAELHVVGDKLKVDAPAGALTPEVRARIAEHKQDLLVLLRDRGQPDAAARLDWWQKRLANLPDFCALPPDRAGRAAAIDVFRFVWNEELSSQLRRLGLAHRSTLFMVLLAALAVRLRAATGLGDIVIGTSLEVRDRADLETMIGPFVDVVVLRLDLDDDPSFARLLSRVRETLVDAHEHREVPFEALIARLDPHRLPGAAPLFQVSAVMHDSAAVVPTHVPGGGAVQNMTWHMLETAEGLAMTLEYRSDLYESATVERLTRQLEILLRAAIEDPSRVVGTLPLMAAPERLQVTAGFNMTQVALEAAPMIVQFERQAARTPDAIALRREGVEVSYDSLNRRANRLARHLRGCGAGPGMRVGLCLDRSADLLAALLAIAKTGAAYVPLDPGFPTARLEYMIDDSELTLLVVDAQRGLGAGGKARAIDLAADAAVIAGHPDTNVALVPNGTDPAYVIYTSGSTGRPNGVVVSHAALANFLGSMLREPGLSGADVVAAITTVSFDIAALELYVPLLAGACIVLVPRSVATDGEALSALLTEERVTFMQATPATWRLLLEAHWSGAPHFVACCGGDVLTADLARSLVARVGALWNLYGPTETTVWSTLGRIETGVDLVTIGRPTANTQVYILDRAGAPTPVGVPGEIWIGGAGVASGYWRNPELTGKRFLSDPFDGSIPRGSIYRTGDMARWLGDGRIVHMGRLDLQLKLRGFRIEPGEIESELAAHPAIREAVVVMRGDSPERERLVAYVVYRRESAVTTSEVREHLRRALPDYMIPAVFVAIDAVPWTPNGKVDRRALPDPFRQGNVAAGGSMVPATDTEQLIAGIWRDALGVERVGAEDNFFDLGGHSLLGLHVAAKIHERTGWRMPTHLMFRHTLRQIAASLDRHQSGHGAAE